VREDDVSTYVSTLLFLIETLILFCTDVHGSLLHNRSEILLGVKFSVKFSS